VVYCVRPALSSYTRARKYEKFARDYYGKTRDCAARPAARRHDSDCDTTFNNYSRHPGETCDIKTSAESRDRRRDSAISEARCKSLERAGRQIVFHEEIVALIVRRAVLYCWDSQEEEFALLGRGPTSMSFACLGVETSIALEGRAMRCTRLVYSLTHASAKSHLHPLAG